MASNFNKGNFIIWSILLIFPVITLVTPIEGQKLECISFERNATSVAGPSPSPEVIQPLETGTGGIANITELEKLTGNNRAIILNSTDISNPKLTLAKGLEKSQTGELIAGEQGTIFEGQILQNVTNVCWEK
jgi:hypothetical protein